MSENQRKELFTQLEQTAKPLQDFLYEHFDPMTKVEVGMGVYSCLR